MNVKKQPLGPGEVNLPLTFQWFIGKGVDKNRAGDAINVFKSAFLLIPTVATLNEYYEHHRKFID